MITTDILIIGAGASGLTCAARAASGGHSVTLIEGEEKPARKILVSGGGKCNFTNMEVAPANYICENKHFCKSALARWSQWDTISAFAEWGIPYEEREEGRLFCLRSAADVTAMLMQRCKESGCNLHTGTKVTEAGRKDGYFHVVTSRGLYRSKALVLATGSPAWPQTGADDTGHRIAARFGHRIVPVRPALVPLVMPAHWPLHGLSGISLPAAVTCGGKTFTEPLLFTHKGISGPVTLQASSYWKPRQPVCINFLPHEDTAALLRRGGKGKTGNLLCRLLPERLVTSLLDEPLRHRNIAELSAPVIEDIATRVHRHTVVPERTEGMRKAEAACGGVDTAHVSSKTMESTLVSGLYFTGEILDVTGHLGGYNLQWAWASGHAAGTALKEQKS
ncbi:HI0933 family protein [Oleidesulfovibrio alaskensis G20]|jgi:hypothetical protein|uniref:HI0933 family protein n=1 Tax=Oleidesulfovibrio alaskensis (strain ATCC BAA-1058 / DSM 17464 / G20) TaxID=207559 RepID=Q311R9_OLEA2|nr:NAD(P)/FAD-dependent oxidoreductase [Oleidesulfovibrio alaskensis]ABB38327.1 HI0933 family protein [Oleidesulfovibrio alaskensis G20]MBG0774638.1 NAD(P)/FAD-dependent oxidoreductase [Oleidesulfovibrio alaskensis]